jgi:hypothetical protein
MRPKVNGHSALVAASSDAELSPKSSLTDRSAAAATDPPAPDAAADSDVDLPRNSHREVRARPCWGSFPVAWSEGGEPKTCVPGHC